MLECRVTAIAEIQSVASYRLEGLGRAVPTGKESEEGESPARVQAVC